MTPAPPDPRRPLGPAPSVTEVHLLVRLRADGADVGAAVDAGACTNAATLAEALRLALPPLLSAAAEVGITDDEVLAEPDEDEAPPPAAPPVWVAFARDDLYRVERRIVGRFPCAVTLRPSSVVVVAPRELGDAIHDVLRDAFVAELPVCPRCGCTEDQACAPPAGPCAWSAGPGSLCTACAGRGGP